MQLSKKTKKLFLMFYLLHHLLHPSYLNEHDGKYHSHVSLHRYQSSFVVYLSGGTRCRGMSPFLVTSPVNRLISKSKSEMHII